MKFARIKDLRKQRNYTQKQVADSIGVTMPIYSNYENGKTRIPIKVLIKLSYYYNTSVDYLMEFTDDPAPYEYKRIE